jgi:hypothetical protein
MDSTKRAVGEGLGEFSAVLFAPERVGFFFAIAMRGALVIRLVASRPTWSSRI